jgi:rhamnogalacturonan endolyase
MLAESRSSRAKTRRRANRCQNLQYLGLALLAILLPAISLVYLLSRVVGAQEAVVVNPWRPTGMPRADADGFVLVRGGTFWSGDAVTRKGRQEIARVEDFQMLHHPVTNAEYQRFIDATGFTPPLHWQGNQIPAGLENHPVVYVNRYDVDEYLKWRTKAEGRVYRLPTNAEFEYAARGGLDRQLYPWGDDEPTDKANFDATGGRLFDSWRANLKPVKLYQPNAYGLYDMAGNVWQMTLANVGPHPARARFKFRINAQSDLENSLYGGSWARTKVYLRCGYGSSASPGIRHPDIGFRVVREPGPGAPAFNQKVRRMVAAQQGTGRVSLSWQLLADDPGDVAFNVYRSTRRDASGFKINQQPLNDSTNFTDATAQDGKLYYYRVRPVVRGAEGASSEWVGVETNANKTNLVMSIKPLPRKGSLVPNFGDLNGDGLLDCVLRFDNGNTEMSRDPGVPTELEAYTGDGRFLWRRPLVDHAHSFGSANDVPVNVYDLDGDGRAEIICRVQEGDEVYLGVLDGMSGRLLRKTPWPPMLTDFAKSSTRIQMSIAYLDGQHPAIITQTGLYENEVITAFDADLKKLWEFRSLAETNGSGAHYITVADVNGDGRDEVFNGTTCLNPNGTMRWSIYREHPDVVAVYDFLPEYPGLEVFYAVESNMHAGAYLVEAETGKIIWKVNREDDPRWTHAHTGWAADIWDGSPGLELFTNRDGHLIKDTVLLSTRGKILLEPFPPEFRPVEWDGDATRELISNDGRTLAEFDGKAVVKIGATPSEVEGGRCVTVADIAGDFRDEVIVVGPTHEGGRGVFVYTSTAPIQSRQVTRTADRDYRLWMAHNLTGGYWSYFEPAAQKRIRSTVSTSPNQGYR